MGTSSLYKGPKITSLLPSDYNPDVNPELDAPDETIPTKDEAGEAESQQDDTENEESNEQKEDNSTFFINQTDTFFIRRISDGNQKIILVIPACIFFLNPEPKLTLF